jgi:integration host factor subunit beta
MAEIMTRSGLIKRLSAANPHLSARDIKRIINALFQQIGSALARGDRVELRGFGVFSTRGRGERVGCNPRTGAKVVVPGRAPQPSPRCRGQALDLMADVISG